MMPKDSLHSDIVVWGVLIVNLLSKKYSLVKHDNK